MKLRLRLAKENIFLSHLEFVRAITRALRRSCLPVKYSSGCHPRVKLSLGPALALGIKSRFEYLDIVLEEKVDPCEVMERLNNNFPEGIEVLEIEEISPLSPPLTQKRHLVSYRFSAVPEKSLKNFEGLERKRIRFIKIFQEDKAMEIAIEIGPEGGLNPVRLLKEIGDASVTQEELAKVKIEKIGFKEF